MESDRLTFLEFQAGLSIKKFRTRRTQIFLNILGIPQKYGNDITSLYIKKYPTIYAPVQDAKNVLKHLQGKFRLGVISNGFPDVQYKKLETLELKSFVDCIVLSEELGAHKPDPEIFLHAVSLLNTVPAAAIHIGDSFENDVIGAKKAGLLSCWFNPLHKKSPVPGIKPDFEIQSLNEIYTCLISCFSLTESPMKPPR
ncbi:MAG: HAD family hydrolase [Desulfobacteraceae bacterium]|nr:MAG: HAD family hydrolase [Desulfobacteraceae bacterium]